jgi:hypothetical protein
VARAYLDEDVDVLLCLLLKARGIPCSTAREQGMLQKEDEEQLEFAVSLQSTLITHNRRDFEDLYTEYLEQGRNHFGIIVAKRQDTYLIARKVVRLLKEHPAIEDQLWYI